MNAKQTPDTPRASYSISPVVHDTYDKLFADEKVQAALAFIRSDNEQTMEDQIQITEIPAPPFHERRRGEYYKARLEALGLKDVRFDDEGNVFGLRPGTGSGPTMFVCAHLDTVFPEGTDTTVTQRDGKYFAPGIADDGRGLAVVLSLVRALQQTGLKTHGDILFGATVGEEGLGDLRGVKAFFRDNPGIDGFISIEPGEPSRTTYLATGSHRYRVTYRGPGGHSFGAFGTPSAIHALGRAIAMISDITVPEDPKTTFTVGEIRGGTSINTIAAEATMMIDMRSNSEEELRKLEAQVLDILQKAADDENRRWGRDSIRVEIELVGNRPAGSQPADAVIVQAAMAATKALGFEPELDEPHSTDSNVPISLGIPAVTLGGGGTAEGFHTLDEWFDPTDAYYGVQKILLTILGLVGVQGVSEPLLQRRFSLDNA
jgi:tripeptide aminopeptidase